MASVVAYFLTTLAVSAGTPLPSGPVIKVQGNPSCVTQCRAAHSQCRVQSKSSQACDAQLQSCLQSCLSRK